MLCKFQFNDHEIVATDLHSYSTKHMQSMCIARVHFSVVYRAISLFAGIATHLLCNNQYTIL